MIQWFLILEWVKQQKVWSNLRNLFNLAKYAVILLLFILSTLSFLTLTAIKIEFLNTSIDEFFK